MSAIKVGNASEAIVLATYLKEGFPVSIPFGSGCAYDLIVDTGARLLKIQVKTGWQSKGGFQFKGRRRIKDSKHKDYTWEKHIEALHQEGELIKF